MATRKKIEVQGTEIALMVKERADYISLTGIAKYRNSLEPFSIINNWMRARSTIEFLGLWERLSNPNFKPIEFERFRMEAGHNYFVLSPQRWVDGTNAIGILVKSGRYGGTFAHSDIAFEFASWISPEFKLYLVKEFQRLKDAEIKQLGWDLRRDLTKIKIRHSNFGDIFAIAVLPQVPSESARSAWVVPWSLCSKKILKYRLRGSRYLFSPRVQRRSFLKKRERATPSFRASCR